MVLTDLPRSIHFHKWSGVYILLIAWFMCSLVNLIILHTRLRRIDSSTVINVITIILISIGFAFIVRSFGINRSRISSNTVYLLTCNSRNLGVLLFGLGAILGPVVTLYLIACYLVFAPLFVDNEGSLHFDNLTIAVAFGILFSG